jgi:plasmid stability protein
MSCDFVKENVELYVFGELSFEQEETFESHLAGCAECHGLVEEHRAMLRLMNEAEVEPPAVLLAQCRQGLKRNLDAGRFVEDSWHGRLRAFVGSVVPEWPRLLKPAFGCAMLALSFYAGQQMEERKAVSAAGLPTSRIRTIQGTGNGMVQIVLEEPRQRMIEGGLNEVAIEQALLAAARQSPDAGMRLESVDLLRNRCNRDDVRRTMLQTLEHDESPVVRLRALEALRPHSNEKEVRQALSRVLLKDTSPNVRVQAIDLLVDRPPAEIIGTLQEALRRDENDYVRARALRVLSEMRASPGVF